MCHFELLETGTCDADALVDSVQAGRGLEGRLDLVERCAGANVELDLRTVDVNRAVVLVLRNERTLKATPSRSVELTST